MSTPFMMLKLLNGTFFLVGYVMRAPAPATRAVCAGEEARRDAYNKD